MNFIKEHKITIIIILSIIAISFLSYYGFLQPVFPSGSCHPDENPSYTNNYINGKCPYHDKK